MSAELEQFTLDESQVVATSHDKKDSLRGWVVCFGFHIAILLNFGTLRTLPIFLGDWQEAYGVENSTASLVPAGCFAIMGIACLLTTFLHDRVPPRLICISGGLLGCLSFVAASFASSLPILAICSVVGFVGCTASYITCFVTLGSWMERYRPLAFALANSGSPIAGIVFPVLFRFITKELNWRGCFLIIAAFFLHHCLAGMLLKPFRERKVVDTPETKPLLKDPRYLIILPYMLFHFGALVTGIVYHPSWARLNGIGNDQVSILVLIMSASDLFVRLISGPLLTIPFVRRHILVVLIGNEVLTVVGALVMGMANTFNQIAGASVLYGMAYGNWFTVYFSFLADFYGTPNLSKAIGYSLFVGGVSNLIFPPVLGKIKEYFDLFALVFFMAGGVAFLAVIMLIILYFYDKNHASKSNSVH